MEPTLVRGADVMRRVAAALGDPTCAVSAAVAYLTTDHLGLGPGDRIAVNLSDAAVEAGATNPHLIRTLQRRGVVVVNNTVLHAKVIVRGGRAAVGSANLSGRTLRLHEAVWVSDDPTFVADALGYVNELLDTAPVTAKELDRLALLYPPGRRSRGHEPAGRRPVAASTPDPFDPATVTRVFAWVAEPAGPGDDPGDPDDFTPAYDPTGLTREWVPNAEWRTTEPGDVWVEVGQGWVRPPRRVLAVVRKPPATGASYRWTMTGHQGAGRSRRAAVRVGSTPAWVQALVNQASELGAVEVPSARVKDLLGLWDH